MKSQERAPKTRAVITAVSIVRYRDYRRKSKKGKDEEKEMTKEILRIKYIKNGKTITEFSMNFRKWRRLHRIGGGCPYVIETTPSSIDMKNRIEITLRSEEADSMIEAREGLER